MTHITKTGNLKSFLVRKYQVNGALYEQGLVALVDLQRTAIENMTEKTPDIFLTNFQRLVLERWQNHNPRQIKPDNSK